MSILTYISEANNVFKALSFKNFMNNSRRTLVGIIKDTIRRPLAWVSLAALSMTASCQMAQVEYMKNFKEGKETPILVEQAAKHRNYLDDTMPTTTLGQWDLAYDSLKQIGSGLPNPFPTLEGIWGTVFHGSSGFIVPFLYPASSKSRSEIFKDIEEKGMIKPAPNGFADTIDAIWSTPFGDAYRTFAGLFTPTSEPFIPRAILKAGYRIKNMLTGLSDVEKAKETKIDSILDDDNHKADGLTYFGHVFPIIHHWWSINGTELYGNRRVTRHAPGRGIRLQENYLSTLDTAKFIYQEKEIFIDNEEYLHASIPFFHSLLLYPARDAAIIGGFLYPLWKKGNGEGNGGSDGGGLIGGESGGPGAK